MTKLCSFEWSYTMYVNLVLRKSAAVFFQVFARLNPPPTQTIELWKTLINVIIDQQKL